MVKALFLDRDGTINIDYGYVFQPEKFEFINGIIVITNQSGIARGYFSEQDFAELNSYMLAEFTKQGIKITDVFYCPELSGNDRKPNCGMFIKARDKYGIDMAQSVSVGDKKRDIEAAQKAGCGKIFLFTGDNFIKIMEEL